MVERPTPNPAFNAARGANTGGNDMAGLVVDVQLGCITHMVPEDAQNYLTSLATQIDDMRTTRGVPVIWATVDHPDNTKFHLPIADGAAGQDVRSPADLAAMGFYALAPDKNPVDLPNKEIFDTFITMHGPRGNEAVFTKPAFNAFATSERDRTDARIPPEAMPRINTEHARFLDHLQSVGTKNLAVFGAVGSVCCLETAIGGVQNGLSTSLMLDGVVCWRGEGQKSQLVWREGFENTADADLWHRSEIRQAVQKPERGFSQAEIAASTQVRLNTYQDLIAPLGGTDQTPALGGNRPESRLKM